jgi:heme exporter protein A
MKLMGEMLSAVRGGRTLFEQISFSVGSGETLVLTGPNGAGKTTLLRMLAGLLQPSTGRIRLEGERPGHTLSEECHYVGHLNGVKAMLTVEENACFWATYLGGSRDAIGRGLAAFGLAAVRDVPAAYLSAGQRRRLSLSRLLMAQRAIWLLDEPTASLDKTSQEALSNTVGAHLADGGLVVAATHIPLGFAQSREFPLGGLARAQ